MPVLSMREQLDQLLAETTPRYGLVATRLHTKPGHVFRVTRGPDYVGAMRYNQQKKMWSCTSPHRGIKTRAYWGTLLEVLEDMASVHIQGEAPPASGEKAYRVIIRLSEDDQKALGRRAGFDRPISCEEFQEWMSREVRHMVEESLRVIEVETGVANGQAQPEGG